MSRKNLVDGSLAYKERKFDVAEDLFRRAVSRDPEGETVEGRTAQVFLARTLHSGYIGDRGNKAKAEEAIQQYQKALSMDKNDQASYKAVASLYNDLQRQEDWERWVNQRANDAGIEPQHRAEALVSLAARQNTCANEISDTEETQKTVQKDGKDVYQYVKPANPADFERFKVCVAEGNRLIDQAVALEPDTVKNAAGIDPKSMTDAQLKETASRLKVFESARSYNASLNIQEMRLAEMEGRAEDRDRLKAEADKAKEDFLALSNVVKSIEDEIAARAAAAQAAANANTGAAGNQ